MKEQVIWLMYWMLLQPWQQPSKISQISVCSGRGCDRQITAKLYIKVIFTSSCKCIYMMIKMSTYLVHADISTLLHIPDRNSGFLETAFKTKAAAHIETHHA